MTSASMPGTRRPPPPGHPVIVVFGRPQFSAGYRWSDIPAAWTGELRSLADRIVIEHTGHNQLGARLVRDRRPVHVVVPITSVRRHPGPLPPVRGMRVRGGEHMHDALRAAEAVIIAANHLAGQPPLIDAAAIAAMRPGALLVNVARGGLPDDQAALRAVRTGHLGGLGLDVYPQEPYPADGPLVGHPRVIATAHTGALTGGFFRDAARRLGEALHRWTSGLPPANLLVPLPRTQAGHVALTLSRSLRMRFPDAGEPAGQGIANVDQMANHDAQPVSKADKNRAIARPHLTRSRIAALAS